jgi:nicotinate-nucleotide adenylyltransferase
VAAKLFFGAPEPICDAIRWHTTGKPEMNLLEKILYLADMIEPNRDYPGVERIRTFAYQDLDAAMAEALSQSVASIRQRKLSVYKDTMEAYRWYISRVPENKEE